MANYNEEKIYTELSKLTPDEMYMALGRVTEFVKNKLQEEKEKIDSKSETLQQKIQKISGS